MKTKGSLILWKKNTLFLFHMAFVLIVTFGWQLPELGAQDWATCVKPVNIPDEIDVVILNEKSEEKIIQNETDDHWFQYYFGETEDHSINMIDDNNVAIAELLWEVYDRNGICVAAGISNERFGPALVTPPLGADPLGADIYFIRVIHDPETTFVQEVAYFLSVNGTAPPKVYGEIKDALDGQKLAGVKVRTTIGQNFFQISSVSSGFYMLEALDGINVLNYNLDGHEPEQLNNFIINKADHIPQNAVLCPENVPLTATPSSGKEPLTVTFDLPDVNNPDVTSDFDWDFGNNLSSDNPNPAPITYFDPGRYNVQVTVSITLPQSETVTRAMECTITSSVEVIVGDVAVKIPRYRLYNPFEFKHFYTTDENEYNTLGAIGWIQEGIAYYVYDAFVTVESVQANPFFRLYNPNNGLHLWTTDANEYAVLGSRGWTQEGIDGYIFLSQVTGTVPLYRLYNPNDGKHLWTTDLNESNVLVGRGFNDEGITGYVFPR